MSNVWKKWQDSRDSFAGTLQELTVPAVCSRGIPTGIPFQRRGGRRRQSVPGLAGQRSVRALTDSRPCQTALLTRRAASLLLLTGNSNTPFANASSGTPAILFGKKE
jgi:hypothetical protein